ncbi:MAG: hypothetical protein J6W96_04685 [Alphaproteobacteria bacterium]|nr:hypothetical protein [Alphaproteobacteria bacterium]
MDIEDLEKLRKLKDKGALTQKELDEQVANYLNSAKVSQEKIEKTSLSDKPANRGGIRISHIICLGFVFIAIYIVVENEFPKIMLCNEEASQEKCNCIKQAVSRNISFLDKVKILVIGSSREELNSYLDLSSRFRCSLED